MNKYQYFCVNDDVILKLNDYYFQGKISDFYKYNNELRIKIEFSHGILNYPAKDFKCMGSYWLVGC